MYEQLSFFDEPPQSQEPQEQNNSDDPLKKIAFLYTATECGNNSGIRFMMSLEDALIFCGSPKSQGVLHGTHWAFFFTSVYNFLHAHDDYGETAHANARVRNNYINLKGCAEDKGTYDWLIDELKLKKYNISAIPKVLAKYGVECLV